MKARVVFNYVKEIAKWSLVIWLFLPLRRALEGPVEFARVAVGAALFVIFAGKLLYDVVFFPRQHQAESSTGKDLLSMLGIIVALSLVVLLLVVFIGMLVVNYMNATSQVR